MGYRAFGDRATLDAARDHCFFTLAALEAHGDKHVRELGRSLASHLAGIEKVVANRRAANDATIRANALVRMRDGEADDAAREFSKDVLAAVRQDRTAPMFRLLLQHTASDIVALSLAPELDAIDAIVASLGDHSVPKDLARKWNAEWKQVLTAGREALAQREAAARAEVTSALEVERWIARADKLRRAIDGLLTQYAADHDLPADFNSRFFPATSGSKRVKKSARNTTPTTSPTPASE